MSSPPASASRLFLRFLKLLTRASAHLHGRKSHQIILISVWSLLKPGDKPRGGRCACLLDAAVSSVSGHDPANYAPKAAQAFSEDAPFPLLITLHHQRRRASSSLTNLSLPCVTIFVPALQSLPCGKSEELQRFRDNCIEDRAPYAREIQLRTARTAPT